MSVFHTSFVLYILLSYNSTILIILFLHSGDDRTHRQIDFFRLHLSQYVHLYEANNGLVMNSNFAGGAWSTIVAQLGSTFTCSWSRHRFVAARRMEVGSRTEPVHRRAINSNLVQRMREGDDEHTVVSDTTRRSHSSCGILGCAKWRR
jgi:hypothetical protein